MSDVLNIVAIGVLLGGIYALVSVGLNLIFGVIRVVNFAQGEFVMLGMYGTFAAYATLGIDPYLAVVLVVPTGATASSVTVPTAGAAGAAGLFSRRKVS